MLFTGWKFCIERVRAIFETECRSFSLHAETKASEEYIIFVLMSIPDGGNLDHLKVNQTMQVHRIPDQKITI
jgi:hypothetical protein